jgi:hypothetical protein
LVLLILLLAAASAWAQSQELPTRALPPVPLYEVKRAATPITVDGKVDDAAWRTANVMEFQFPWDFQTGAKQKTRARVLWDDQYLYVSYEAEDTDITAPHTQRDDPTYQDDAVEIFINPSPAQHLYYGLEMNARGILYDYFCVYPLYYVKDFDMKGVKIAAVQDGTMDHPGDQDRGWSLEVAIPWENFHDLARKLPPDANSEWTANLNRWDGVAPNRRLSQWSDSGLKETNPHNPGRFGRLRFVR